MNKLNEKKHALLIRLDKTKYPDLLKEVFLKYPDSIWESDGERSIGNIVLLFPSDRLRIELLRLHQKEFIAMSLTLKDIDKEDELMNMIKATVVEAIEIVNHQIFHVKHQHRVRKIIKKGYVEHYDSSDIEIHIKDDLICISDHLNYYVQEKSLEEALELIDNHERINTPGLKERIKAKIIQVNTQEGELEQ